MNIYECNKVGLVYFASCRRLKVWCNVLSATNKDNNLCNHIQSFRLYLKLFNARKIEVG